MTRLSERLLVPDWPAPPGVQALQTTRQGGYSQAPYDSLNLGMHVGDDALVVAANRQILAAHLPSEPVWLEQVHGKQMVWAEQAGCQPRADACVTQCRGAVCAVMTADCLPILLCDRGGSRVGAVHAGWRGLAAGVIEAAIAALGAPGAELLAWLGPAIGPQAFEVGEDVRAAFLTQNPAADVAFQPHGQGRYLADIYQLARQRMQALGVSAIFGGDCCTYHEPSRFYSYRREGVTGRMASMIWLA